MTNTATTAPKLAYAWDCREEDQGRIVLIGIDQHGGMHLMCAGCAADAITNPDEDNPLSWHGTHILSNQTLDELLAQDEQDA